MAKSIDWYFEHVDEDNNENAEVCIVEWSLFGMLPDFRSASLEKVHYETTEKVLNELIFSKYLQYICLLICFSRSEPVVDFFILLEWH